jgi:hypothetical protein
MRNIFHIQGTNHHVYRQLSVAVTKISLCAIILYTIKQESNKVMFNYVSVGCCYFRELVDAKE